MTIDRVLIREAVPLGPPHTGYTFTGRYGKDLTGILVLLRFYLKGIFKYFFNYISKKTLEMVPGG